EGKILQACYYLEHVRLTTVGVRMYQHEKLHSHLEIVLATALIIRICSVLTRLGKTHQNEPPYGGFLRRHHSGFSSQSSNHSRSHSCHKIYILACIVERMARFILRIQLASPSLLPKHQK